MKKCTKCKEELELIEFCRDIKSKDGFQNTCKLCRKINDPQYRKNSNKRQEWVDKNPNYMKEYHQKYPTYQTENEKRRKKIDPIFKLKINARKLVSISFKRSLKGTYKKGKKTELILGCTLGEFIIYLQSLFIEGMTLENHGKWEMDHIIPISSAKTEEEIYALNHYTNFQPLWKEDNRRKGDKIL